MVTTHSFGNKHRDISISVYPFTSSSSFFLKIYNKNKTIYCCCCCCLLLISSSYRRLLIIITIIIFCFDNPTSAKNLETQQTSPHLPTHHLKKYSSSLVDISQFSPSVTITLEIQTFGSGIASSSSVVEVLPSHKKKKCLPQQCRLPPPLAPPLPLLESPMVKLLSIFQVRFFFWELAQPPNINVMSSWILVIL